MNVGYYTEEFFRCPQCRIAHKANLRCGDVWLCKCGYKAEVTATWTDGCSLEPLPPPPKGESK